MKYLYHLVAEEGSRVTKQTFCLDDKKRDGKWLQMLVEVKFGPFKKRLIVSIDMAQSKSGRPRKNHL